MKVIFLDIDGVLNDEKTVNLSLEFERRTGQYFVALDENKVRLLSYIVYLTNAKIVLSSSWRFYFNINTLEPLNDDARKLNELFKKYNMNIYSVTENLNSRENEIASWLNKNRDVERFVIIDDDSSDLMKYAKSNLIKTSNTLDGEMIEGYDKITGLTLKLTIKTIFKLNMI